MRLKRNIRLMYAIALLQGMVFYGPIATLYRQASGLSIFQITLIESISLALCLLLELPWGIVADKIGYRNTMIVCCLLFAASKIVFWRAAGFPGFLFERILLSVVIAGMSGVDISILYLSCADGSSQKVFGIYNNLQTTGLLFAALLYSLVLSGSYRLAGLLTVVSYGAAAALSFGLREVKSPDATRRATPRELMACVLTALRDRRLLLLLLGVALLNDTHQTVTVFLNQLQYVRCGLSDAAIGVVYVGVTMIGLLGVFSETFTRRLGARFSAAILYGFAAAACFAMSVWKSAWLSVAAVAVLRLSFSLFQPLQTELQNRRVRPRNRATELSVNAVLIDCVGVGTNLVYGKLDALRLPAALLAGGALCAAGYVCFLCGSRRCSLPARNGGKAVSDKMVGEKGTV